MKNIRRAVIFLLACSLAALSVSGCSRGVTAGAPDPGSDITGCYVFEKCLYMSPLSSFMPFSMPYVYGVGKDALIVANTETGDVQTSAASYEDTPVAEDEFSSGIPSFPAPDLSAYGERRLRAVFGSQERLYQMDGEIWLVGQTNGILWSIYRLQKTDQTTLADLERALEAQDNAKGMPQLTMKDVYALAGRGDALTPGAFSDFAGKAAGVDFSILRYDLGRGCALVVHSDTPDSPLNYARLAKQGYDPFDADKTVDIREGKGAVAAYLDPLHSLMRLKIEDGHGGAAGRELIYEFDGYRYYLNSTRADRVFVTFENGDRLPLKRALEERRLLVEDAVANGLYNVSMEPVDNPLGGMFPILHHNHTFSFDGEAFYPSAAFMYITGGDSLTPYFNVGELADTLELQGRDALAQKLRGIAAEHLTSIAGKAYITAPELSEAGITVEVGWALSSHTPVDFTS